jgi:hypothetical protein
MGGGERARAGRSALQLRNISHVRENAVTRARTARAHAGIAKSLFALEAEAQDGQGDAECPENRGGSLEDELVAEGEVVDESADKGRAAQCLCARGCVGCNVTAPCVRISTEIRLLQTSEHLIISVIRINGSITYNQLNW